MQLGAQLVGFGQCHGRRAFFTRLVGRVGPPDVKADVYLIGLDPERVAQVQRHEHQRAAKDRCQVHAFGDVFCHRFVKAALEARRKLTQIK